MNGTSAGHRQQLLEALRRFVVAVRQITGVRRIAVLGSIVTAKPNPKDIDVLVVVADDADLTALATCCGHMSSGLAHYLPTSTNWLRHSNMPSNIACTRRAGVIGQCRW